ncbi:putative uncharacterized protein DDB_G0286901 [Galleria mellonella]|uniref:GATA zinc finger domain-containing protein 14-like n=1 Tax=Galleria mellonella TaxID=7137 RepID=A0ABM3MJW0_GALME|nr:putative uncharacterized protein DDB_G0286901 [Galleria mellonella]
MITRIYLLFVFWVVQRSHVASARSQLFSEYDTISPPMNPPPALIDFHGPSRHKTDYDLFGSRRLYHNNLHGPHKKDRGKLWNTPGYESTNLFRPKEYAEQLNVPILKETPNTKQAIRHEDLDNSHEDGHQRKLEGEIQSRLENDPLKINLLPESTTTTESPGLKTNIIKEIPSYEKYEISNTQELSNNLQNQETNYDTVTDSILIPDEIDESKLETDKISKNEENIAQSLPINETIDDNTNHANNRDMDMVPIQIMIPISSLANILQKSNESKLLFSTDNTNDDNILSTINENNQNILTILSPTNISDHGTPYTKMFVNLPQNMQQATLSPSNISANFENQGSVMITDIPNIGDNQNNQNYLERQPETQSNPIDKISTTYSINDQFGDYQYSTQSPQEQLENTLARSNNVANKNTEAHILNIQQKPYFIPINAILTSSNQQENTNSAGNQLNIPSGGNVGFNKQQMFLNVPTSNGMAQSLSQNIGVQQTDGNIYNSKPFVFQNLGQQANTNSLPENNGLATNLNNNNIPKSLVNYQTSANNFPNNVGVTEGNNGKPMLLYVQQGNQYDVGNNANNPNTQQQYLLINIPKTSNINPPQGSVVLTSPNGNNVNSQGTIIPVNTVLVNSNGADLQSNLYTRINIPNTYTNNPNVYFSNVPVDSNGSFQLQSPYNVPLKK